MARRWGVTPEGLRSKARIKTLTVPRQIAMYLARELLEMQLVEIGQAFGGRDHSTVIHSVDKVSRQMSRDRNVPRAGGVTRDRSCAQNNPRVCRTDCGNSGRAWEWDPMRPHGPHHVYTT